MRERTRRIVAGGRARGALTPAFSLVEMLIALAVGAIVVTAILTLFNTTGLVGKEQLRMSDMQNASRVSQGNLSRLVRMAGRGGLPRGPLPSGLAVAIRNDTPMSGKERQIAIGDTTSPPIVAGTDVLTIRGVFSTPIYQLGGAASSLQLDIPTAPTSGTISLSDPNPDTGVPQDLSHLEMAIATGDPEALILVSPASDAIYAVVELDPTGSAVNQRDTDGKPTDITLAFKVGDGAGSDTVDRYLALSAGGEYPAGLQTVAFAGILEEYRYFIRERFAIDGDPSSQAQHALARGKFFPGTETYHPDLTLQYDIADNIMDLQIAVAIDRDGDGDANESALTPAADDWLFNDSGDNATDNGWNDDGGGDAPDLFYVRLTTLARTDRPDTKYIAPAIDFIEDHEYGEPDLPTTETERLERIYRRRVLQTVVDLRNL